MFRRKHEPKVGTISASSGTISDNRFQSFICMVKIVFKYSIVATPYRLSTEGTLLRQTVDNLKKRIENTFRDRLICPSSRWLA